MFDRVLNTPLILSYFDLFVLRVSSGKDRTNIFWAILFLFRQVFQNSVFMYVRKSKCCVWYFPDILLTLATDTSQKMKVFIKDFFNKCDQIRSFLRIRWHLLKKSLMQNFIFCAVCWVNRDYQWSFALARG